MVLLEDLLVSLGLKPVPCAVLKMKPQGRNRKMKRNSAWIALLMALCMVLALVACSSKSSRSASYDYNIICSGRKDG